MSSDNGTGRRLFPRTRLPRFPSRGTLFPPFSLVRLPYLTGSTLDFRQKSHFRETARTQHNRYYVECFYGHVTWSYSCIFLGSVLETSTRKLLRSKTLCRREKPWKN